MTLQQLEYILSLYEHANFTRAADACGVTQPTLSTMIQRLETELGAPLFDRTRQPVMATELGKCVVEQARMVLSDVSKINDIVNETKHSLEGTFRVSLLPTIAPFLLPLIFPPKGPNFDKISLNIKEFKTARALDALLSRDIDMAIIASEPDNPMLDSRLLFYEEFLGYVSQNSAAYQKKVLHSSDVDPKELFLLNEGHCFRDQLVRFCKLKAKAHDKNSYGEGSLLGFMHIVEAGYGVTFIPQLAEKYLSAEQQKHIRPFATPRPVRGIYLVWHKSFVRYSIIDLITKLVQDAVPKEMLELSSIQMLAK